MKKRKLVDHHPLHPQNRDDEVIVGGRVGLEYLYSFCFISTLIAGEGFNCKTNHLVIWAVS